MSLLDFSWQLWDMQSTLLFPSPNPLLLSDGKLKLNGNLLILLAEQSWNRACFSFMLTSNDAFLSGFCCGSADHFLQQGLPLLSQEGCCSASIIFFLTTRKSQSWKLELIRSVFAVCPHEPHTEHYPPFTHQRNWHEPPLPLKKKSGLRIFSRNGV